MDDNALPVFVIHYNSPAWCEDTVSSFFSQRTAVDVTVMHNGGSLPSTVQSKLIPLGENLGYAGAANEAIKLWLGTTRGEFAVIACHDAYLPDRLLEDLLQAMASDPKLGVVAPEVSVGPYSQPQPSRAMQMELADWVSGTLMLLRRSAVLEVDGFDRRFGSYVEDVDICYRIREAGWLVGLLRGAVVSSRGSASDSAAAMTDANWELLSIFQGGRFMGVLRRIELSLLVARAFIGWRLSGSESSHRYMKARARAFRASMTRRHRELEFLSHVE